MGLDIYLEWSGMTEEEQKARYTGWENAGASGYLRSSYNDGGFDSWARRNLRVNGFQHIFDYDSDREVPIGKDADGDDEHGFYPDWKQARERTYELLEQAQKLPPISQVRIASFMLTGGIEPEKALSVYTEERERWERENEALKKPFGAYSSMRGEFFMDKPITVRAVIPVKGILSGTDMVLICDDPDAHTYYIDVLHQVLKFIELGERKNGWLGWSG